MRFPPDFLRRVVEEVPVSQVVATRVSLKRKGQEFWGCCPFHHEKSASFKVNDLRGKYHCFGCGAGGNALDFLMQLERLSFPEAVERLAGMAGLPLPVMTREAEAQAKKAHDLYAVIEMACRWFEAQLVASVGAPAREYLTQRGYGPQESALPPFRLGYAPDSRDALTRFLQSRGVTAAQAAEAGLAMQPESGSAYDRFRGRLMFPIADGQGRVVAFGGRLLGKGEPKYLNSPEHPLFHKGRTLYGWHVAKDEIARGQQVVVAEGYFDVLALHRAGVAQAVAPLGTALTEEHLKALWKFCPVPTLCLDGDEAGLRAMQRTLKLALPLLEPGKSLQCVRLPVGQDPDSVLTRDGAAALKGMLLAPQPMAEMLWEQLKREHGGALPEQRAALEAACMAAAESVRHPSVKHYYQKFFREKLYAKRGKAPADPVVQVGVPSADVPWLIVGLLLVAPQLLHEPETEDFLSHFQSGNKGLDNLCASVLEAYAFDPDSVVRDVHRWARQDAAIKPVYQQVISHPVVVTAGFSRFMQDAEGARECWRALCGQWQQQDRKTDERQQLQRLARDFSPEDWERFVQLKRTSSVP